MYSSQYHNLITQIYGDILLTNRRDSLEASNL